MGQLLPLLLSRHKWCFWKHGEHFLGVDIYWVVQMFLKWKSNSSNYQPTDGVQRPVFFKLRLITMVEKPMSVCHVYILGRRINSFGRNRTKPSVFKLTNKRTGLWPMTQLFVRFWLWNWPFARWRHFITTTTIFFVFPFTLEFGSPSEVWVTKALICKRKQTSEGFWS